MQGYEKLKRFIEENKIDAEIIVSDESTASSKEAASNLNQQIDSIAKSICLVNDENKAVVAILLGNSKIDIKRLSKIIKSKKLRLANDDEILNLTGYERGGVPPVGYDAQFVMDEDVAKKKEVFCGGGSKNSILRINPSDIIRVDKPIIADIKKTT